MCNLDICQYSHYIVLEVMIIMSKNPNDKLSY